MKNLPRFILFFYLVAQFQLQAQQNESEKPKLVIGIVVDQMRFDYLYKYESRYGETGFKRLLKEGFNFKNTNVNYVPSETAPGHASIYTGTTPAYHGIIGNSWFDKKLNGYVGSVDDSAVTVIGSKTKKGYGASPKNLTASTISDELRLGSNFRSKVISVSLKDRGAILPGGTSANAAYWFDWEFSPGYFITSSHYMKKLPKWVASFNALEKSDAYLNTIWNTLYPLETYTASAADNNTHEYALGGKATPTFPYNFKEMREKYTEKGTEFRLLLSSPDGNSLLTDFAIKAIEKEKLGTDEHPDLLNISYSVPDVIGHTFGPQSVEMEDVYLRLDQNLGELFAYLDTSIGIENYTVFLTADHAAIPVVSYLEENKLAAGVARVNRYKAALQSFLSTKYGAGNWIQNFDGSTVYLNKATIDEKKLLLPTLQQEAADFLITRKGIYSAITAHNLQTQVYEEGYRKYGQNGYHPKRSGDVMLTFDAGTVLNPNPNSKVSKVKGTVHGSGYSYDTQVPLLWMGKGIPKGAAVRKVNPIDIAPTLALILNLQMPSSVQGVPLKEFFENN